MYGFAVDVGVTELRANLSDWLAKVREGEEVTVTDRGLPVARVVPVGEADPIERLTREGVLSQPESPYKRHLPRPTLHSGVSLSDIVIEFRDEKR